VMLALAELKKPSVVAVHFVLPDDIDAHLGQLGLEVMETSIASVNSDKELFTVISTAMRFPDYFGNNWDALDECLGDMDWLPSHGYLLILYDAAQAWSTNPYVLGKLVTAWLEAAEFWANEEIPFHLVFVM